MSALPIGFGMGLLVAAQLGPLSLFLIRSVLRGSLATGLAIGAGIAVVDTLYAAAGAAGAAPVLTIDSVRVVFGVIGALVLAVLGVRTLHSAFRVRLGAQADEGGRRRGGRGGGDAAPRVRHLARGDRVEPAHDRLVGRAVRHPVGRGRRRLA